MARRRNTTGAAPISERPVFLFALVFTTVFLLHGPLLRLPYFWDEAGYFIPAAYDFFKTGDLIPHSTLANAHPPLVMIWLAAWWKLSNYAPAVTRTAMLLVSALGLVGVFRLSKRVANTPVAWATTMLTALYPVIFAQSSLAQLDMPTLALSIWGLYAYVEDRRVDAIGFFALACLAKDTAVAIPLTIFGWEVVCAVLSKLQPVWRDRVCVRRQSLLRTFLLLISLLPLVFWYVYYHHRTGYWLGNPEYFRYNVGATTNPFRIVIALFMRLWHAFGYMNLFVLTAAALLAMQMPPIRDDNGERRRIDLPVQVLFGVLVLAHVVEFAVLGGALLARYMVPVIPLVILVCVSTLYRRVSVWKWWCAAVAVAFVAALLVNPPWRISPEDNLAYSDFVRLHKEAAVYIQQHYPDDRILTAWPASDELNRPYLGYVTSPHTIVRLENFTIGQVISARLQLDSYDVVFAFSTKYDPPRSIMNRFRWWNGIQERFFDYHSDLSAKAIAELLGGRIAWQKSMGGEWVAIIDLEKIRNAKVQGSEANVPPPQ